MAYIKYDIQLIQRIINKQPSEDFNRTDVAKEYCLEMGIEYRRGIARTIQDMIRRNKMGQVKDKPLKTKQYEESTKRKLKASEVSIITYAQAHTRIDKKAWNNLLVYAKHRKANVVVIPGTYENLQSTMPKLGTIWAEELLPYLHGSDAAIHPHLKFLPTAPVLPTAVKPLSGMSGITGAESSIIGHPKQHMETQATLKDRRPKFMFTTGAMTLPNYTISKAGKKGEFHHKIGFLIVENIPGRNREEEDSFVARHVTCKDDGSFMDVSLKVADGKVSKVDGWSAFAFGDTHIDKEDKELLQESRRLIDLVGADKTIWHDLFDGYSIKHHDKNNYSKQVRNSITGRDILEKEMQRNYDFIDQWLDTNMIIIPSNHNDWIDRWVTTNEGYGDAKNAVMFNELQAATFRDECPKGLYAYLLDKRYGDKITTLGRDKSYMVEGIEVNNHGDLGANGSRGTPNQFHKLNVKILSGDKHNMYTYDLAYGLGISGRLDHGYNRGMSSWGQGNGIIHRNGEYQHLMYFNGKFTNQI